MAKDEVLQSDEDNVTLVKEIIFVVQGSMLSKRHKYCRLQIYYSPLQYCCLDYIYIGTSGRHSSRSPFRRSTDNDVSGH